MTHLKFTASALVLAALIVGCSPKNTKSATPKTSAELTVPQAQLPGNVVPQAYRLDMRIDPNADTMSGVVSIDVDLTEDLSLIWMHGKEMTISSATALIDNTIIPLNYNAVSPSESPSGVAYLTSEAPLPKGAATLELTYETPYNLALNSAYKVTRGDDDYIVTQMEPLGAREAFPSFDEPKYKVPFTVSITAPADDVVYANTPLVSAEPVEDGWVKHEFTTTPPLPTYLIAFGVGPYNVVDHADLPPTDIRSRAIPLRGLTARGKASEINYGLENTAGILEAIEGYFGIPYPYKKLDLIAAPEYAFGAMENPGAIVYREYLMLMDEKSALSQRRAYASVHSHEIAHQWFGNLVTPVWWEDIWLNEAFATWMGNKGINLWKPDGDFDRNTLKASLGAMNIDSLSTTRKVREPLDRSENVLDQFDAITYRKGGGVLDMFESFLGVDKFQAGVRLHMKRYADSVATADDFFQSIADGSGNPDVVSAMKSFVDQPGLPIVTAVVNYDGNNEKTKVHLTHDRYAPLGSKVKGGQQWQIPICVAYGSKNKRNKQCTLLDTPDDTIEIEGKIDWITLNENGAGYYRFALDTNGWIALLDNLDKLNPRELLTVQDSLESAFRAGKVEAAIFISGMEKFSKLPEYDVASAAGNWLGWMYENLPESSRPDIAKLTRDMYAARYKNIVGKDTVEGNLLTPTLAARLVRYGNDTVLETDFSKKGRAYIEGNKDTVAPNLLSRALGAAMEDGNMGLAANLLELAKNGTSFEKSAAIGALAQTQDKEVLGMLLDTALIDEETLTGRQATSLVSALLASDTFGKQTWDWVKADFAVFVNTRVPDVRKGSIPALARNFCTLERRDEAKAFFEKNAKLIPGYELSLAQTLESIELCAALKSAKAEETAIALAAR